MTIDYQLVASELREDLENLAQKHGVFTSKVCADLDDTSELKLRHRAYVTALNDALRATCGRYHTEYKPIDEKIE
jgi:hypothetical protein